MIKYSRILFCCFVVLIITLALSCKKTETNHKVHHKLDFSISSGMANLSEVELREITNTLKNRMELFDISNSFIQTNSDNTISISIPMTSRLEEIVNLLQIKAHLTVHLSKPIELYQGIINNIDNMRSKSSSNQISIIGLLKFYNFGYYVERNNKNIVNNLFYSASVKAVIPSDVTFAWSKNIYNLNGGEYYRLYCLKKEPELLDKFIKDVEVKTDSKYNTSVVKCRLTDDASVDWKRITGANIAKEISFLIDELVFSSTIIARKSSDDGEIDIEGFNSFKEAEIYAVALKSGPLPYSLYPIVFSSEHESKEKYDKYNDLSSSNKAVDKWGGLSREQYIENNYKNEATEEFWSEIIKVRGSNENQVRKNIMGCFYDKETQYLERTFNNPQPGINYRNKIPYSERRKYFDECFRINLPTLELIK